MPQMSPLSWTCLYMYFCAIMILFMIMNYYMMIYKPNKNIFKKNKITLNWKW
uniref:ATP synthase complex subunit 8 n=1 Tax=Curculionoidea sp. 21 KM-2017 TaxID=2219405 RepID=A0A346RKD6_9CUCU|nr:ATP synthase F0 subunit 8 [Curculionoidea sp. 21 KM-2017]